MATHEKQKRSLGFFNIFSKSKSKRNNLNNNIPRPSDGPNVVTTTNPMSSPAISLPRNSDYYYGDETIKTIMSPMVLPMKSPNSYGFDAHQEALEEAEGGPRRSVDVGGGRRMLAGDVGRKSVSHVEANLASVVAFLQVKVLVTDMPGHMQVHAFRCARRTFDSLERFSSKHMAYNTKKEFDKVYGPAWHCIVGPSFGSFVTHSAGCFLYFTMEKLYILVFKTKVQKALD